MRKLVVLCGALLLTLVLAAPAAAGKASPYTVAAAWCGWSEGSDMQEWQAGQTEHFRDTWTDHFDLFLLVGDAWVPNGTRAVTAKVINFVPNKDGYTAQGEIEVRGSLFGDFDGSWMSNSSGVRGRSTGSTVPTTITSRPPSSVRPTVARACLPPMSVVKTFGGQTGTRSVPGRSTDQPSSIVSGARPARGGPLLLPATRRAAPAAARPARPRWSWRAAAPSAGRSACPRRSACSSRCRQRFRSSVSNPAASSSAAMASISASWSSVMVRDG